MGAEIFNVQIVLTNNEDKTQVIAYATKVSSSKNRDTNTTLTFNGDVSTSASNTGGSISIEGLYWPETVEDAINLENLLNSKNIKTISCAGDSYLANGTPYRRQIIGNGVTVTSDEDEWSPSDGITQKLEFAVNELIRKAE